MAKKKKKGPTITVEQDKPGLVGTMARTTLIAGTATATVAATSAAIGAVTGGDEPEQPYPTEQAVAQAPVEPEQIGLSSEQMQQLQQLAALKEQGVLTEEEFNAQKAVILAAS